MRSIRKATFAVAAAGLLAFTAACGGSSDGGSSEAGGAAGSETRSQSAVLTALQASQDRSQEASSASFRTEMTTTMALEEGAEPLVLPMQMHGALSWDPLAMDVTVDMSGYLAAFAEMMGQPADELPSGEFSLRYVDNVMYMGGSMIESELAGGKSWIRLDLEELAQGPGGTGILDQLTQAEDMAQSPAEQLGLLLGAPNVEWRGSEQLDGRLTHVYEGELTLDELLAADPSTAGMTPEELAELHEGYAELGADTLVLKAWVDEQDLPVRIDMTLDLPEGSMHYSTTYSDFGTGIGVTHPADSELADFGELASNPFGGGSGGYAGGEGESGWGEDLTDEELEELLRELEELGTQG